MTPRRGVAISTVELDPGILLVTLDRPERLNAITATMVDELAAVVARVDLDPDLRVVVVTGAGRGFCAGLDLHDHGTAPGADDVSPTVADLLWQDHLATLHERIHRSRKPWIAAVNGPAVGGGFALALACDLRIASTQARFGAVFMEVGVSNCDMGTSYFLPRLVGAARSAELLLTGRTIDADEAARIGLAVEVVAADEVVERAIELGRTIARHPPFATWMTKETMWQTLDAPSLRHAIDIENRTQILCAANGDVEVARAAFAQKRSPTWGGL